MIAEAFEKVRSGPVELVFHADNSASFNCFPSRSAVRERPNSGVSRHFRDSSLSASSSISKEAALAQPAGCTRGCTASCAGSHPASLN